MDVLPWILIGIFISHGPDVVAIFKNSRGTPDGNRIFMTGIFCALSVRAMTSGYGENHSHSFEAGRVTFKTET
jgi:hypothetical protein